MTTQHPASEVQAEEKTPAYTESPQIVLSERDSIALVNSIRYPGQPNELLKETMRKNQARK